MGGGGNPSLTDPPTPGHFVISLIHVVVLDHKYWVRLKRLTAVGQTHGRNPILAASWMGVKRRKLRRVGSAPASNKIVTDSFFCAKTAQ